MPWTSSSARNSTPALKVIVLGSPLTIPAASAFRTLSYDQEKSTGLIVMDAQLGSVSITAATQNRHALFMGFPSRFMVRWQPFPYNSRGAVPNQAPTVILHVRLSLS